MIYTIITLFFFIFTTGSTLSLICDKVPATFGNLRKIIFQDTQASPGSFVFKEGADYYYIGELQYLKIVFFSRLNL